MDKINLSQKLSLINDHWNPRIIGELNGQYLKLVKFKGPFTWHHHETEDEMFLVVKGRFRMELRENGAGTSEPASSETSGWKKASSLSFLVELNTVRLRTKRPRFFFSNQVQR
jgi:uncharacterized protein (DUF2249 family)